MNFSAWVAKLLNVFTVYLQENGIYAVLSQLN